jgi:membrane protein
MSQQTKTRTPIGKNIRTFCTRLHQLLVKDIWELQHLGRKNLRARAYLVLRILSLTLQGTRRNRIPVQSAALTFYSLVGIGPLIALAILISGFALEKGNDALVVNAIAKAISFAAPQVALNVDNTADPAATELNPQVLELINNFADAAQSGTVGALGALMLGLIALQVLASIEGSFNTLWGVARGRKFTERIVVYWTFISLGAVLGTASLTLVTFTAIARRMEQLLPFGQTLAALFLFLTPLVAFLLLTLLLALFFRFIPNTRVEWKPAFIGSAIVILGLYLYNKLSFLYMQRVVDTNSLYGSVGILVVLMLGLYIFWLLILLGGQLTYSVQNANYLTDENAWEQTSSRAREVIALGVLLHIAECFRRGQPPLRTGQLQQALRIPSHILNACLERLCRIGWLCPVQDDEGTAHFDRAYQAARPIDDLTLRQFKQTIDTHGNNDGVPLIAEAHPGITQYLQHLDNPEQNQLPDTPIQQLTHPTDP